MTRWREDNTGDIITGDQIKRARQLLRWTRTQISVRARGVTANTISKAEDYSPGTPPTGAQLAEIRRVLEAAGVEFTNGDETAVKLRKQKVP